MDWYWVLLAAVVGVTVGAAITTLALAMCADNKDREAEWTRGHDGWGD